MLPDNANSLGVVTDVAVAVARPTVVPVRVKYVPILANPLARSAASVALAGVLLVNQVPLAASLVFVVAWIIGITATEKYTHKYPYRYISYLLASHLKATAVTA